MSVEFKECPHCSEPVQKEALLCRFCDRGISPLHFKNCPNCTEKIWTRASFCRYCKSELPNTKENSGWGVGRTDVWGVFDANVWGEPVTPLNQDSGWTETQKGLRDLSRVGWQSGFDDAEIDKIFDRLMLKKKGK